MPEVPSVRGAGFLDVWERVTALIDAGEISRDDLEVQLEAEDLEILDSKPEASLWYPITSVERLAWILVDSEGGGCPEYQKVQGRRAAESLITRSSIKSVIDAALKRGERAGPFLLGMASLIYSFGSWSFDGDLNEFSVELSEAEAFPELSSWAVSGFAEVLFQRVTGSSFEVTFARPAPERVIFRGRRL